MACLPGPRARSVPASGRAWPGVLAACLGQLDPLPERASLGIVYLSEALAPMADEIVRALRAHTGLTCWLGACGRGVLGGGAAGGGDGLAVLVLALPEPEFAILPGAPAAGPVGLALAHGELGPGGPAAVLRELAAAGAGMLIGGLTAASRAPVQIAGDAIGSRAACLDLARRHPTVAGIATAGAPLGPSHRVTSVLAGEILALDGRPALTVMTDELGDLFRHSGARFAPVLWVAEPETCRDGDERMRMRRITRVDARRGSLQLEGDRPAAELRLMRPDPAGSLARVRALARRLLAELDGAAPMAAVYLASRHRGRDLFGPGVDEIAILQEELGRLPLVGLVTDAEIYDGAMHEAAGVLALIG